ncbi:MAG TPA: GntP family permease, partial [Candidatus Nesterenkonia stercoripullorum]|nr:GntP family permease [Candidatus Nesterenkonia stercoripullorum]
MEDWTQTLGTAPLLGIAVAAVALILFLVIRVRLHAFLVLVVVSLLTALATGIPADMIVDTLLDGFGGTLGSVALLIGLGAILGRLVESSGGAKVVADKMVSVFGEKRAAFALGVTSLLLGF